MRIVSAPTRWCRLCKLKGQFDAVTVAKRANAALRDRWPLLVGFGPFPFPVVVLFFPLCGGAWYAWAAEPVVTGAKRRCRCAPSRSVNR